MRWVCIGSRALKYHGLRKNTEDHDIWTSDEEQAKALTWADVSVMPQEILNKFEKPSWIGNCASINDLYTIKLSHLVYDIFWWKHAQDVLLIRKNGAKINLVLYDVLCSYWKEKFEGTLLGKRQLNLYQTKDSFFDDFVKKQHEHDYLHKLVAKEGIPVYTKCLVDGQEVAIDSKKVELLSFQDRVLMMKEEIAVIALERWIIPSGGDIPICHAWNKSLHKTVTALTKGSTSRFIVENIEWFLSPLYEDMERALSVLNIKEKNMNYEDFKEMIAQRFNEQYPDGYETRWYTFESGDDLDFDEILLEGFSEIGIELIEQEGGGEGGAENCYSVLKIDDKFYKVFYNYYSHHGFDMDYTEVREVKPQQKVVTVYE